MKKNKNTYFEDIQTDVIPMMKCPECGYTNDCILLRPDDNKGFCSKCNKYYDQETFTIIEEKQLVFICKECKLPVPKTPGNITMDGKHYMCPKCCNFLAPAHIYCTKH